jgi:hypothetical protein
MLSSQEEQREREEVMRQDADLRKRQEEAAQRAKDQSGTFFSHGQAAANDMAGGRFAAINPTVVVGAEPVLKYPQLPSSSPWSGTQPEPPIEPPLGVEINKLTPFELEPSIPSLAQAPDDPANAPLLRHETGFPESAVSNERAGSSFSNQQSNDQIKR